MGGIPAQTILVNPVPTGPAAPSHTGNGSPVSKTPVNTGTNVRQPDATEIGVEALYVMVSDPLDSGSFTRKQLDKKFKHASDFGIADTKKNSVTLTQYRDAIEAHLKDRDTVKKGTYRREKGSKVFFNTKTNNVVVLDKDGDFISGWNLISDSPQYNSYIKTGVL